MSEASEPDSAEPTPPRSTEDASATPADEGSIPAADLQPGSDESTATPVHRWVFRALVLGVTGGLLTGATMFLSVFLRHEGLPSGVGYGFLFTGCIALTWCALLAFSEQVVRRRAPWLRPILLTLIGATAALLAASAFTGVEALIDHGPARAWSEVIEFYDDQIFNKYRFDSNLTIGVGTLLPFAALGSARLGFTRSGPSPIWLQLIVAAVTGVVSTLLFSNLNDNILSLWGFTFFTGGAIAACFGMWLGQYAETFLVAKIKNAVDPPD